MSQNLNRKIVRSTCTLCSDGCGVLINIQNGIPVSVKGDPEHPANRGVLCVKGAASLDFLNCSSRLKQPLKRIGERGQGKWQVITWDEALNSIAEGLNKVKQKNGPEAVAFIRGGAKGYQDRYLARFANIFGSPNVVATSNICFMPRLYGSRYTYGHFAYPDYEYPPACIITWGFDGQETSIATHRRIQEALFKGSKLIAIDPAESIYAKKAELWVKPRPASDLALALGMIHVIINEKLYDEKFVAKWTVGFKELKEHVQKYPPEKVAELTWVPAAAIQQAARTYAASKPACIEWGNGLDSNINSFQTARAISILRAITGNLGIPGGEIEWSAAEAMSPTSAELNQPMAISSELRARRIGAEEHILPTYFSALPQKIVKAMLTSKPYPIRAAYVPGAAMLHSYNNSPEVMKALKSLDFLAVADFFLTPTAEMADIVLPVATYLETDSIHECAVVPVVSIIQKVAQVGEAWSDLKIYNELAKRMGMGASFWNSESDTLDYLLQPSGVKFEEFRKIGILCVEKEYRNYETKGFETPSKKVEIYSSQLEQGGFDPLPVFHEVPESPFGPSEFTRKYPLVLINWKVGPYLHSAGRQIPALRNSHPDPLVILNSETAAKLGIKEGDWVYIENKRGKIRQKAVLSDKIDPRVVIAEHGWWYPEKETGIHGWAESNLNMLTDNNPPYGEIGSTSLKGFSCKVYPC